MMFLISVISAIVVFSVGFYFYMIDEKSWRVYYKRKFKQRSNVTGIEIGSGSHLIDNELYYQSVLMNKATSLDYLKIFDDAVFIMKRRGINKGKRIVKG